MSVLEQAVEELTRKIEVRSLRYGETIPVSLNLGFPDVDSQWCWVAVSEGQIVGVLLAAPCHGVLLLARLVVLPGFGWALPRLLRRFIRDARKYGDAYVIYLDLSLKAERKILAALKRAGNVVEYPITQTLIGGSIADLEKW